MRDSDDESNTDTISMFDGMWTDDKEQESALSHSESNASGKRIEIKDFDKYVGMIEKINLDSDAESSDSSCNEHFVTKRPVKKKKQSFKSRSRSPKLSESVL